MKKIGTLAVIGAVMAFGLAQTRASTIEQQVKIELKGVTQSGSKAQSVKVSNKDILKVLTVIEEKDLTKGKLMLITDTASTNENPTTVVVRVKGQDDTDVSEYFDSSETSSDSVSDANNKKDYSTRSYKFTGLEDDLVADLDVAGYTTEKTKTLKKSNVQEDATETQSTVSGEGQLNGNIGILQGKVSVSSSKLIP